VRPPGVVATTATNSLPFCLYFPAMDGKGLTATAQFSRLSKAFDLHMLQLDPEDRSSFDHLVELSLVSRRQSPSETRHVTFSPPGHLNRRGLLQGFLEEVLDGSPPSRPVYLIGDSWGALLALGTALRSSAVQRLVLINPATVMGETPLSNVIQVAAPALALAGDLPSPARLCPPPCTKQSCASGASFLLV
jgi:pimeloyl-ACP methyl ester carboxylesterase